jgi:tetratricopeptide (TPR) repeat protein
MIAKTIQEQSFVGTGRGPVLSRWIHEAELYLPNSEAGFAPSKGSIVGADYEESWVIFHRLQVMQSVPHEVHTSWHWDHAEHSIPKVAYLDEQGKIWLNPPSHEQPPSTKDKTGVWLIEDSKWLKSLDPQHLGKCYHFILEFYDEIVEVICEELVFGTGKFNVATVVQNDKRFSYAYLRYAMAQEKQNNTAEAIKFYQKYLEVHPENNHARVSVEKLKELSKD